jgi:uncharacterized membrane protein YgdD (TMEM256/DUF423 family)
MPPYNPWILTAAVLGALAVLAGAYHAHGLERQLVAKDLPEPEIEQRMEQCDIAVRYQTYHALGILAIGGLTIVNPSRALHVAASLMMLGVLMFCGGLYLNVFLGRQLHWAVIPLGGLSMIAGWIALGFAAKRRAERTG